MLWFSRFTDYRLMEQPRSLLECVNRWRDEKGRKRTNYRPGSWRRAFAKWHWKDRAEAWDEHLRQEKEAKWEKRRNELQEQEWEASRRLLERGHKMEQFPLYEARKVVEIDEKGNPISVQIVKPVRWSQADIPKTYDMASRLGRLAAEMETDKARLDIDMSWEIIIGGDDGQDNAEGE